MMRFSSASLEFWSFLTAAAHSPHLSLARLHSISSVQAMNCETTDEVTLLYPRCGARTTHPLGDITWGSYRVRLHVAVMEKED